MLKLFSLITTTSPLDGAYLPLFLFVVAVLDKTPAEAIGYCDFGTIPEICLLKLNYEFLMEYGAEYLRDLCQFP